MDGFTSKVLNQCSTQLVRFRVQCSADASGVVGWRREAQAIPPHSRQKCTQGRRPRQELSEAAICWARRGSFCMAGPRGLVSRRGTAQGAVALCRALAPGRTWRRPRSAAQGGSLRGSASSHCVPEFPASTSFLDGEMLQRIRATPSSGFTAGAGDNYSKLQKCKLCTASHLPGAQPPNYSGTQATPRSRQLVRFTGGSLLQELPG